MPTVATLPGQILIRQYHCDHNPPHFHAVYGDQEALITIAEPLTVLSGQIDRVLLRFIQNWARLKRKDLALNWVDALAGAPIQRIE